MRGNKRAVCFVLAALLALGCLGMAGCRKAGIKKIAVGDGYFEATAEEFREAINAQIEEEEKKLPELDWVDNGTEGRAFWDNDKFLIFCSDEPYGKVDMVISYGELKVTDYYCTKALLCIEGVDEAKIAEIGKINEEGLIVDEKNSGIPILLADDGKTNIFFCAINKGI